MELVVVQNNNNQWQTSVVFPRVGTPFISPDGKTMYLSKKYRERTNKGDWSELKNLDAPLTVYQQCVLQFLLKAPIFLMSSNVTLLAIFVIHEL